MRISILSNASFNSTGDILEKIAAATANDLENLKKTRKSDSGRFCF